MNVIKRYMFWEIGGERGIEMEEGELWLDYIIAKLNEVI